MWVLAVYDTPMTTPDSRRAYTQFRRMLLRNNFVQHQFSVYLRHCPTMAAAEALIHRIRFAIPEEAHVAFFLITDKQYGMTREFWGPIQTEKKPETPAQVELF